MRLFLPVLFTAATLSLAACGSDDSGVADAPALSASAAATSPAPTTPADDVSEVVQGECSDVAPAAAKSIDQPKPTGKLDAAKTYVVTMQTSCGAFQVTLDQKRNPKTANSFAKLASSGFYDGLGFHRISPGFVIQGGDPSGDGSGGPDWQVVEAPQAGETYPVGTVAMAKTAADPAGASGSQFFVMLGSTLPPEYAVAGRVTKGMDAIEAIAKLASAADGPPSRPAVISAAKLTVK